MCFIKMNPCLRLTLILFCFITLSCQEGSKSYSTEGRDLSDGSYVQLLERIEKAGNRYRSAIDLLKYSASALERSLAESHLQLTRGILESEFGLADLEAKDLALREGPAAESNSLPAAQGNQTHYEKAAAEVWKIYSEVEDANKRLAAARQNFKKATTAEAFRRAQQAIDQAQKEVMIANKKLDLAGSNLDIEDYQRKKGTIAVIESRSLAERLKMLREELFPPTTKSKADATVSKIEDSKSSPLPGSTGGGIVASFRDFFARRSKLSTLRRVHGESLGLLEQIKNNLLQRTQHLEKLQLQHMELNQKADQAYNQAYELLKTEGGKTSTAKLLEEANQQMVASERYDKQKELASRALQTVRKQAVLAQDDREKLTSWVGVARDERNQSLIQVSTRLGIVLGLIVLILLIAHYLKKLPYKFTRESKNIYYFRKLISFFSGLIIALIVLLNFVGDFGSVSAVVGLAGAGLAIALQDPIVSLVGWFLIIGKFGISVGDRIEINKVKGDVIDIGLLRIAVLEVGNWVSAEQSTGRVVFFPNSFIFKNHFFNYSTGNSFIWDEIHITVTYDSDWKRAREIIENLAQSVSSEFVEKAKVSQERVSRHFYINLGTLTPYVYVSIVDSGVDLVLRYLTEIRRRRMCHDRVCREILEAFDREPGVNLACPTRRNVTETKVTSAVPDPSAP